MSRVPSYDLALYFASKTSHAWGVDVFTGRLPDTPHEAIAFSDQGWVIVSQVYRFSQERPRSSTFGPES